MLAANANLKVNSVLSFQIYMNTKWHVTRNTKTFHSMKYWTWWVDITEFQVSSTCEWNTKLGNVVVMSLFKKNNGTVSHEEPDDHFTGSKYTAFCQLRSFSSDKLTHFKYWRVIFFRRDGCRNTKLLHSSLSIFPSCLVSASSKVYI